MTHQERDILNKTQFFIHYYLQKKRAFMFKKPIPFSCPYNLPYDLFINNSYSIKLGMKSLALKPLNRSQKLISRYLPPTALPRNTHKTMHDCSSLFSMAFRTWRPVVQFHVVFSFQKSIKSNESVLLSRNKLDHQNFQRKKIQIIEFSMTYRVIILVCCVLK